MAWQHLSVNKPSETLHYLTKLYSIRTTIETFTNLKQIFDNEKCFQIFAITSQNKTVNNIIRLNHFSRMNNTLQKKIKYFPHNFLNAQKHPQNENDTTFSIDPPYCQTR